ncbi:MAG: fatty acid desaturase [Gammaproteobacteria bacterium]
MKILTNTRQSEGIAGTRHGVVNTLLIVAILCLNGTIYFLLPWLHLPALLLWTYLTFAALTTPLLWALIHESIHRNLWPNRRVNRLLGRLLGIVYGAPFVVLRAGHLMHHRRNRSSLDRTEVYDPNQKSWWIHAAVYYPRLLGGLYLAEVASGLLGWLPRSALRRLITHQFQGGNEPCKQERAVIQSELLGAHGLWAWRNDALLVVLVLGMALANYGSDAGMLVFYLLMRGLMISLLDNSYHYATPLSETRFALNLWMPWPLAFAMLHFNLHGVHHAHVQAPCHELAKLFRTGRWHYHGAFVIQVFRQFRGPIAIGSLPRANAR